MSLSSPRAGFWPHKAICLVRAASSTTSAPADIAVPPVPSATEKGGASLALGSSSDVTTSASPVPIRRRRQTYEQIASLSGTRALVGPPDPLSNLRPILPACPAYASHKTSLYAPDYTRPATLVTHPYEISEVAPEVYNLDVGLETARQELEVKELHWRLLRHRQETLAQDFWSAMNAKFKAMKAAAEAEGISEEDFLRTWVNENHALYRSYDKEWNQLLRRSLRLAFRGWKRDVRWQLELFRARARLWKEENLPRWLQGWI